MHKSIIANTLYLVILFALFACGKGGGFVETDPATGAAPIPVSSTANDTCKLSNIQQINGQVVFTSLQFIMNNDRLVTSINFQENGGTARPIATFQYKSDSIKISNGEWLIKQTSTGRILEYFHIDKINDLITDSVLYTYVYDQDGKLIRKSAFYNRSTTADFISTYSYQNNELSAVELKTSTNNAVILRSEISYDAAKQVKPWIYCFTDFFENNLLMQGLNFGKRVTRPITQIKTTIYSSSNSSIIDTWSTSFNGYVFSPDNYILQVSMNGDSQQGLGTLVGTNRFIYHCK